MDSQINSNVVKTALDKVFYQEFDGEKQPGYADATTSAIFRQDTIDRAAVIQEVFSGSGLWETRGELQDVPAGQARVANTKTDNVVNYAKSIDISKNFFDDNMHGVYEGMVRDMGRNAKKTRDNNAFALFRNGFTTALTADGAAIFSDSHTTISGATVDNKLALSLTEANLNTAIIMLGEQKAQDGTLEGAMPKVLLVPLALYKTACEITESEYRSGTGNNDMNVYSDKYGIMVMTSRYLGAAAGGSDTAWFLLGDTHGITRYVRQPVTTDLVDYKYQRNNNYIYKGEFREVVSVADYAGLVGSTG